MKFYEVDYMGDTPEVREMDYRDLEDVINMEKWHEDEVALEGYYHRDVDTWGPSELINEGWESIRAAVPNGCDSIIDGDGYALVWNSSEEPAPRIYPATSSWKTCGTCANWGRMIDRAGNKSYRDPIPSNPPANWCEVFRRYPKKIACCKMWKNK